MPAETRASTTLYRIENPNIRAEPDGISSHEELVGQWFTPNLDTALGYLRKSTQTFGKDAAPVEGARLVLAQVPQDELDKFHVSKSDIARQMDVEIDNYLLPRDGSVPMEDIALDDVLEGLHGKLGRLHELLEAKRRIVEKLGELAAGETMEKERKVASFKTERGSVYRYDSEGKSTRFKTSTGKLKDRTDLTVFADLTPEQEVAFMDAVYAESAAPDNKRTVQVLERQEDDNGKFIRDVSEVSDPNKLLLAILQKGRIVGYVPASLSPKVGATVFERRNIKKGGQRFTERHLGHKVTEISYA